MEYSEVELEGGPQDWLLSSAAEVGEKGDVAIARDFAFLQKNQPIDSR
jgi:hypothetical protein